MEANMLANKNGSHLKSAKHILSPIYTDGMYTQEIMNQSWPPTVALDNELYMMSKKL